MLLFPQYNSVHLTLLQTEVDATTSQFFSHFCQTLFFPKKINNEISNFWETT